MLCERHRSRVESCQAEQEFRVRPAGTAQLLGEVACTNTRLKLIASTSGGCLGWFRQGCFVDKNQTRLEPEVFMQSWLELVAWPWLTAAQARNGPLLGSGMQLHPSQYADHHIAASNFAASWDAPN